MNGAVTPQNFLECTLLFLFALNVPCCSRGATSGGHRKPRNDIAAARLAMADRSKDDSCYQHKVALTNILLHDCTSEIGSLCYRDANYVTEPNLAMEH